MSILHEVGLQEPPKKTSCLQVELERGMRVGARLLMLWLQYRVMTIVVWAMGGLTVCVFGGVGYAMLCSKHRILPKKLEAGGHFHLLSPPGVPSRT